MADKFLSGLILIAFAILELAVLCAMGDKSHGLFRKLFRKSNPASNTNKNSMPFAWKVMILAGAGLFIAGVIRWMWL